MEQVQYLQKQLYIKYLPDIKVSGETYKNSNALMIGLLAFTLFNMMGFLYSLSLLIFGIILPICCLLKGADLGGYFPVFSILLWLRIWYHEFAALDVIFIVCLWHPNLRWADLILAKVSATFKKQSFASKISKAAHKLTK